VQSPGNDRWIVTTQFLGFEVGNAAIAVSGDTCLSFGARTGAALR
jgi:hypothetical protein